MNFVCGGDKHTTHAGWTDRGLSEAPFLDGVMASRSSFPLEVRERAVRMVFEHGIEAICQQLPIAPSTYYEQKAREAHSCRLLKRAVRYGELREAIKRASKERFGAWGARKAWR